MKLPVFRPYPPNPYYEADESGAIRNSAELRRMGAAPGAALKAHWKHTRYVAILSQNGKRTEVPVAEIVAHAFHGPPPEANAIVVYLDGDPRHVSAANLQWRVAGNGVPEERLEPGEQARAIVDFPGYYVTNFGRVFGEKRQAFLAPIDVQLHYEVALYRGGQAKRRSLPKLVAEHFPEIVGEKPRAHSPLLHRDGDRANCRADNLQWTTQQALLKDRGQQHRAALRKQNGDSEAFCGEASRLILFLLREYGNTLPDSEPSKKHRYYYIDARFRPLCGGCATQRAVAVGANFNKVDERFPVNQHILFPSKAILDWDVREVVCADCKTTIRSFDAMASD